MRSGWVYRRRTHEPNAPRGLPRGKSTRLRAREGYHACKGVCVARARHTRAPVRMRVYVCVRRARSRAPPHARAAIGSES